MHLIVGLGNPGPKYVGNRHNIGFLVVDHLADDLGVSFREKFKGEVGKGRLRTEDVVLLKPMTFMNLSGESVQKAMAFYKIPLENVIVVHDELDLDEGTIRIKQGGGTAGHNGLKSIVQHCGGPDFVRIRYGVGRPRGGQATANYVLSDFNADEMAVLSDGIANAIKRVEAVIRLGISDAMNRYNRK